MSENEQKVVIVTGGSQGIGAGIVAGYRERGWAVVANALTIKPSDDPAVLTVEGDVSEPATADRIITGALARFGRVDLARHDPDTDASARELPRRRGRTATTDRARGPH